MRFLYLIWQEIRQRPTTMLTGLLTIALGTAALVAIRNVTFFSERAVARELEALGANVLVLPRGVTVQDYYGADLHGQTMPESYVHQVSFSNLEGVEDLSPRLCMPSRIRGRGVILTGILPQSEFAQKAVWQSANLFTEHKGCRRARCGPDETSHDMPAKRRSIQDLAPHEILLGADIAASLGHNPGDKVELFGDVLTVSAILPATGTVDDGRVFMHLHELQRLAKVGEVINAIEIRGCCEDVAQGLVAQLTDMLPGTKVVTIAQVVQTQVSINRMMKQLSWLFLAILIVMAGASIANSTFANVRERRREIGTLMAMGAAPRFIAGLFLIKAALFGLVGGLAGYALGSAVAVTLGSHWAGVAVSPLADLAFLAVGGAVGVSAAASLWPARSASRLDPCVCFQEV